jgi:hypothetical protein
VVESENPGLHVDLLGLVSELQPDLSGVQGYARGASRVSGSVCVLDRYEKANPDPRLLRVQAVFLHGDPG